MSWIKRNLSLAISGVIALGLLGFGGWYLWTAMRNNAEIDNKINQAKSEINALLEKDPTPTASNLNNAKRELDRINAFIAQAKRQFPPTPPPAAPLNNESFKNLLERTVDDLHKEASAVGIKINPGYYFSFEAWRIPVNFPPESLRPLSERLHEVQLMSSMLFKARINRLVSIQRATVPGERPAGGADYLNRSAHLNPETGMVLWPYEITFECFTSELAAVLDSFQRADFGLIVRSPLVGPAVEEKAAPPVIMRNQGRAVTNAAPVGLVTIINEKLLRVKLNVEVIKPETFQPGGGPPPGGRRGGGGLP